MPSSPCAVPERLNLATGRWEPIQPEALRRIELEQAGGALIGCGHNIWPHPLDPLVGVWTNATDLLGETERQAGA